MSEGGQVGVVAHPRRNGWSCPPHPLQILVWCVIIVLAVLHYGVLVFYIPGLWRILAYVIPGLLVVFLVVAVVMTTSIDPSEEQVRRKVRRGRRLRPVFDRSVHEHVIENRRCNLCQVDVSASAKHCRLCDKCVCDFDHHCKWMNNCIGGRNYRWFMATLVLSLTGTILLLLFSLSLFILFFADRDSLRYDCDRPGNVSACDDALRLFGAVVPDAVFPVVTGVLCLVALAGTPAIGHLLVFHLYLLSKGISTYDYIVMHREEERDKEAEEGRRHGRCSALRAKVNRVSPASHLEEVEEGGEVDTASVGSAGMVNFGRTPPPSNGSESSGDCAASKTEELQMEAVASWAYSKDDDPGVASGDQLPGGVSTGTNTNHNNSTDVGGGWGRLEGEGTQPDSPREEGEAGGGEERPSVSLEGVGDQRPAVVQDNADGSASCDEVEDGMEEGGFDEGKVDLLPLLVTPSSSPLPDCGEKKSGMAVDSSTMREGGEDEKVILCDGGMALSLEDRHRELKARVLQDMAAMDSQVSLTPPPFAVSPLTEAELTHMEQTSPRTIIGPPSPPLSSYGPHRQSFTPPIGASSPVRDDSLQELPLSSLRDLTRSPDELSGAGIGSFRSSTPSPLTKHHVSFENIGSEQLSPRPLPPLPPIGGTTLPYETRNVTYQKVGGGAVGGEAPPRGLSSRPLPPLSLDDLLGSQESLLSVPSSLLFPSPSTNSLPQPDPRYSYRRMVLQPIASSNLSLDATGARRARAGRKAGRGAPEGGRTPKEQTRPSDDRDHSSPSPSPLS